jgi:hypothetical protein
MKPLILLLGLLFGGIVMPSGVAAAADMGADRGAMRPASGQGQTSILPFPRSARAQAVWDEGACWRDCQVTCTSGLAGCLSFDSQGRCLQATDACDRSCQRQCRVRGGPYLAPLFD